jgi:ABC-2 type transport system permease protein
MTSANLSLADKLKNHKTYINRTLWSSYIALPFLAAYFILGVIMMVSRTINYAMRYNQSPSVLYQEKLRAVSRIMGMEQIGFFLIIGIAVMFALQGFSYVFNTSQLDFYLSQPTTKSQRIVKNYFNAISTFLIMYLGCEIIALIIAACMGAVGKYLFLSVLIETLRAINLFLAFYNITVLAVMLSGTLPIAILLTGCFTFISILLSGEIALFKGIFFATYNDMQPFKVPFSPIYDRFVTCIDLLKNSGSSYGLLSKEYVDAAVKTLLPNELDILLTGLIAFVFAFIFARMRQAEWAGKSIVIRPFRWLIKIVVCVAVGLGTGFLVYSVYEGVWNSRLFTQMCVIMVIATVVTGCIAEVMLEGNIKKVFKGKAQTVMAVAIVMLIFVIFRGDLLGFDSYVPAADKVESCAIYYTERQFNLYNNAFIDSGIGNEDTMAITNVDDVLKIAAVGIETRKVEILNQENNIYHNIGYNMPVLYRLKNGKKVYRYITVPYDAVDAELGRIVDGDEFKKGYFDVFNDEAIRSNDVTDKDHNLTYESLLKSENTKDFSYAEFSDAYRKDIRENYNFEYMKQHMPIGSVYYESNDNNYVYGSFDVYDTYSNTIALLEKLGIYTESKLEVTDIREVKVYNYYPGYDLETQPIESTDTSVDVNSKVYTDEESIKEIIEGCITTNYYNPWYDYNKNSDQYSVEVTKNGDNYGYSGVYYSFLKGKVPQFVKEDTNN